MINHISKLPPFLYKTDPYEHQRTVFEESRDRDIYGLFWEMGCGKSKTALDTAAWLFAKRAIDGVLIIANKGSYMGWYYEHVPTHLSCAHYSTYWSSAMRKHERENVEQAMEPDDETLDILSVNAEALSRGQAVKQMNRFVDNHDCLIIVDESDTIKNTTSARHKNIIELGKKAKYRRILTGTPVAESPLDLYGQCHFLKPGLLGFNSEFNFRHYYASIQEIAVNPQRPWVKFERILQLLNQDELSKHLNEFTSRIKKETCLDLPEKIFETYYVEHTAEQAKAYADFRDTSVLEFEDGMLTSTSAMSNLIKLMQINNGFVKDDQGLLRDIPHNRINALMDIARTTGGKRIVWCHFTKDVDNVCKALADEYGMDAVARYDGHNSDTRDFELQLWKEQPEREWLVSNLAVGSRGLNLQHDSHMMIYYSMNHRLQHWLQSQDRIHRPGQRFACTYVSLIARGTVDIAVYRALRDKKNLADFFMTEWRDLTQGEINLA